MIWLPAWQCQRVGCNIRSLHVLYSLLNQQHGSTVPACPSKRLMVGTPFKAL